MMLTAGLLLSPHNASADIFFSKEIHALDPEIYLRLNGNFLDSSKTGSHPGQEIGGVTFTPKGGGAPLKGNPHNQAAIFDGVDDYIVIPNTANLDFSSGATLAAWVKFDRLPSEANTVTCASPPGCVTIVAKSGFAMDLDLQAEGDNRFHFYIGVGVPNMITSRTVIEAGRWYFVTATYWPGVMELYVNGVLEAFRDSPEVIRTENSTDYSIGASLVWPGRFFPGLIDEAAIFNKALSPYEIQDLFQAANGVKHYSFHDDERSWKNIIP
jgi:hypothetical protein